MNRITFPLQQGDQGPRVADLQDALKLMLEKEAIYPDNPRARVSLLAYLASERDAQTYGTNTVNGVREFQTERQLRADGVVDQPTANAMNELLESWKAFDQSLLKIKNTVSGTVRREDGLLMAGIVVCAYQFSGRTAILLGKGETDAGGGYTIRYEPIAEDGNTALRVDVLGKDGRPRVSSEVVKNAQNLEIIDLTLPLTEKADTRRRIEGRILFSHGLPAQKMTLRLYRKEFKGQVTLLNETITLSGGHYAFDYDQGMPRSSLEVRLFQDGKEIALTKPLNYIGEKKTQILNLVVPADLQALDTEYHRLKNDLSLLVGDMLGLKDIQESDAQQDLTALNRSTGWDARLLVLAAQAARLSSDQEVNLSQELLYGLLRAGLPSEKLLLAQVGVDTAVNALKAVSSKNIVQCDDSALKQFQSDFRNFKNHVRRSLPAPGSHSTYGELLQTCSLSQETSDRFCDLFFAHLGSGEALWDKCREANMAETDIAVLQRHGKLSFLTTNCAGMTRHLMQKVPAEPSTLVDEGFYEPDKWLAEIKTAAEAAGEAIEQFIPSTFVAVDPADPEATHHLLNAYAEDLARKIRLSYPTHVIARKLELNAQNAFDVIASREATVRVLKAAVVQGFRLGRTPVQTFFSSRKGIRTALPEMSDQQYASAMQQIGKLYRVYQITPDDDAMQTMLSLGFTSANELTHMTEDAFKKQCGHKFATPTIAIQIHRRARQVSGMTYSIAASAAKNYDVAPFAMAAAAEACDDVRDELVKRYPTLEVLFGSMDFCECEHCRSVLSPAAYLVDLLQFLQNTTAENAKTSSKPYQKLIDRRPDIPHIALTCENTNTALPYIDIVNEILEYFIANNLTLAAEAAKDTGDATTEELLAEPQYVIGEAYERVRNARYPLNLPFDLWLDTVREFSACFETPLENLLETLRSGDDLFQTTQPCDRAAIFMESLKLSPKETEIFTNPNPLENWWELYGFEDEDRAYNAHRDPETGLRTDLNSAKALCRRLGITYKELAAIIQTGFINPKLDEFELSRNFKTSIENILFYQNPANKKVYESHCDLLGKRRQELPTTERDRFDSISLEDWQIAEQMDALHRQLQKSSKKFDMTLVQAEEALQSGPFDGMLVLADPDAGCNFDETLVQYAGGKKAEKIDFLKLNLFVRLWRKLGWTIEEIDRALQTFIPENAAFEPSSLNRRPLKTALIYMAHLHCLSEKISVGKQNRLKLLTLWTDMPALGPFSLYKQLFLNLGMLKSGQFTDEKTGNTFSIFDDPVGEYLSPGKLQAHANRISHEISMPDVQQADQLNPDDFQEEPEIELRYDATEKVQYLAYTGILGDRDLERLAQLSPSPILPELLKAVQAKGRAFHLLNTHTLAVQGALGLTADGISRILEDRRLSPGEAALSLSNISILYRYGLLAKGLKLTVQELLTLKRLSGLDPFKPLHPDPLDETIGNALERDHPFSQTLRFVETVEAVKASGLSVEDLKYLFLHQFDPTGKYSPEDAAATALLQSLAEGVRNIQAAHAVPADPAAMTEEVLRKKLGLILPVEVVERFLAMMNNTAEFTAATRIESDSYPPLDLKRLAIEPAICQVSYDEILKEQKLTLRGVLFGDAKADMLSHLDSKLQDEQKPILARLLDDIQDQAKSFFHKYLRKQTQFPPSGFLEESDYKLLFAPASFTDAGKEQQHVRNQKKRLAETFLPELQQRLNRQFIIDTMIAQVDTDPPILEALVTDERLLGDPEVLINAFAESGKRGLSTAFEQKADSTWNYLEQPFATADTGWKSKSGQTSRPPNAAVAHFEGYLEVPEPGGYRFYVQLDSAGMAFDLRFNHLPEPSFLQGTARADKLEFSDYLELKAGIAYHFSFEVRHLDGKDARLLVQSAKLPKDHLSQLKLFPFCTFSRGAQALILLSKALLLLQLMKFSERETRYLFTHPDDFSGLDLKALPTKQVTDSAKAVALFQQFLRLARYKQLKEEMAGGGDGLIEVFEYNEVHYLDTVYALIAELTRRDTLIVRDAAETIFSSPDFSSEIPLLRLWDTLKASLCFGVPASTMKAWTWIINPMASAQQRLEIARNLKASLKARFEPETWLQVARPVFDRLRPRQRDALTALIMHLLDFSSLEKLYEYFLIDPGMEPVVQTSRIRLAIAAVQLFIQRCLLNLEKDVRPSDIVNADQWEWMKRYRVWEANRKIFLFPENWLEPEFRDDKSHLFTELESTLLQDDVSADLVEDALLDYLKKLDELARLDIVAMYCEHHEEDDSLNTLHVFGRTFGEPHKYFYRRYNGGEWTPWEPVSAEIEGDHLAPVVWRDRLYLFWVTFMDKADPGGQPGKIPNGTETGESAIANATLSQLAESLKSINRQKKVEVQLHWSEYIKGVWSTPESIGYFLADEDKMVIPVEMDFNRRSVSIYVVKEISKGGDLGVYVVLRKVDFTSHFYLAGRNCKPERDGGDLSSIALTSVVTPYDSNSTGSINHPTKYSGKGPFRVNINEPIQSVYELDTIKAILNKGNDYNILLSKMPLFPFSMGDKWAEVASERYFLMDPVFYQDESRETTLFMEPTVTERTIEEWSGWLLSPSQQDQPHQVDPDQSSPPIYQQIPENNILPDIPGDPVDIISIYRLDSSLDWLVNPQTVIRFEDELIGRDGKTDLQVVLAHEAGSTKALETQPVPVAAGDIGTGNVVIRKTGIPLEAMGLDMQKGGLLLVGGAGLTTDIRNNSVAMFGRTTV